MEQVEDAIKELKARHLELLDKEVLTKREEYEMQNFLEELAKLEADKKEWFKGNKSSLITVIHNASRGNSATTIDQRLLRGTENEEEKRCK